MHRSSPARLWRGARPWATRSLACQGKQYNLQTMLVGRTVIDASRQRVRDGLQDALTDLPSGNNGALRQGGWTQVLPLLKRAATNAEALFLAGVGSDADPGRFVFEGNVTIADVGNALNQF